MCDWLGLVLPATLIVGREGHGAPCQRRRIRIVLRARDLALVDGLGIGKRQDGDGVLGRVVDLEQLDSCGLDVCDVRGGHRAGAVEDERDIERIAGAFAGTLARDGLHDAR